MFRYLARRHDRKHILRSLQRQKRIGRRSIEFGFDTCLAFAVNEAEDIYASSGELAFRKISEAELFFSPILPPEPLKEEQNNVTFQSDITTADEENNTFECVVTNSGSKDHALVVFHHWYARNRYPSFSRYFAAKGITVIEATLPYHFSRGSDEYSEEQFFNANLGRTVRSIRQAVLDGRKIVRWLHSQGYNKISVVGMCIGGTVAGLIAAQEERVDKAVLMVSPGSPADLVWTAETMKSLRDRIEPVMSLEDLRTAWGLINLEMHLFGLTRPRLDMMFVLGKDDTITRPAASDRVIELLTKCNRSPEVLRLNCGHSSVGIFPYNIIAARKVLRFLKETPTLAELWDVRGFRYDFSEA
ncbi:alpha/beta hydrolase family protein [Sinorhizobium meliloti]|uniref:alpha/beta hydrolase family protein n=1 Tax=Rhizobium meliloti TaxID=382 RepID=UPI000FDCA3D3|nr:dienelactone hydrolase family protein [Sinorhizobium meliloti]RVG82184.1 abhydrolase domain-containing 18 [Sinorhizobium meliloti]RVI25668.1 abhydrolase domain-containing 18 [Sinorhizobium meliloti]RVI46579.1 abhydrolase domain-containing 18 [Sinorhizobium meliloti]RVJ25787.1 abhydrolase domain-containing 18 [Sinorhizobium meliloti]RVK00682.1 abhydrolase domain-containing 18 [Sinorhizobium meliloti]